MENEITESEVIDMDVELQVYNKVSAAVDVAKERCANIVLCYDTPKGIKEAKSFIYDIRKLKAPIAQIHKEAKAQLLKDGRAMDAMKNKLIGAVEDMIEEKYAPIKAIEDAEAKKVADAKRVAQEKEEAEQEAARLEWEEKERTLAAKEAELKAKQDEIDRKEREARIAEQARIVGEENAKQALEDAEDARKQAIVDAENAKAAAVQQAKDEAAAKTAEKAQLLMEEQLAEKVKAARESARQLQIKEEREFAESERINDEKHRSEVHRAIYKAVLGRCITDAAAKVLVEDLRDGKIPHVTIQY